MGDDSNTTVILKNWLADRGTFDDLENRMLKESKLPGPRANLGLASLFADQFRTQPISPEQWSLLVHWMSLNEGDAPANDPREYLPFCAVQAMGANYGVAEEQRKDQILSFIGLAMNDSRWRLREGAAMALQRLGEDDIAALRSYMERRLSAATLLERRAFVAALAHPPILQKEDNARFALQISEEILTELAAGRPEGSREETRVLCQGLEYAVSLFVEKLPKEGFELLGKYAVSKDERLRKIVKSNLGKARLAKKYPGEVGVIADLVESGSK
ncbi:hypothetical protein DFP94_1011036 [Fontibacillus phaseoli]|uniref:HEAT repeat protein n=1 Tax=Fontibacillus phaseoli TaxID=1416533 RepID=A0A369BSP1_9BACL|nr:hypothetical protein [Fontibacillus phaseoli]RCX23437.1 hypothetical protein DFP94_1011036 [Fontibacillus phaseoli]